MKASENIPQNKLPESNEIQINEHPCTCKATEGRTKLLDSEGIRLLHKPSVMIMFR